VLDGITRCRVHSTSTCSSLHIAG